MKSLCKVIIASLLVVCATKTSTAQDLKFTPQEDGEIKGTAYQQSQFGENGLMTLRRPASGGMNLKMHYLDTVNGQITSTKVKGLMKKKLITVDQLNGLIPVLIDGKLYCVGKSKSGKDLILTGRDKVNLEFTGEKETILEGEKELYNYSLDEENNKYFSFVDMSWSYDSEEPFAMKAYVFDKENLDNVLKVNQDNNEADYKDMLGYGITREGSFYMLSTPLDKGNKNDHNLRSGEITFELHNESGKQKMSFEFENGGVIDGSTVIEDENGIRLKVLRILANGGIIVSILEVKDGELIEKSHVKIPYSDLYAGNNSNNVSNFEDRIKEKKDGVIKMSFNVKFTQDHKLLNGGYISVNEMKINAISVLLLTFIDANGEIVRTNCLPASSIVATGVDADGVLNVFLNDAASRYSKEGSFVSYSNAAPTADESPVHLAIDESGEVLKRQILTDGFDKGEKFDQLFKFYSFEANGIILTAKSDCRDSSGNTCYSFTLGTIHLN